ncbi:MAG: HAD family hydrolase [Candidatus Thermoplasmatota archaeon]|jgi:putative hydrolase of the HAD superfamily|nr:HAD family hydrolase [Candidatus Thermoplasmatota archaeon]
MVNLKTFTDDIKIISFDLDGTLVKSTYANAVWLEGVPKVYAKEKNLPLEDVKEFVFQEYLKIGENKKEWYDIDWWFKHFKLNSSWQELLNKYRFAVELYPDTIETIKNLSKKFDLIIISNAKREFIEIQIEETRIKNFFSHTFSSLSDFNIVKKMPKVYKQVCDKLKIKTNEIIHVGDNTEFDLKSPRKIGIKSYQIDREKIKEGSNIIYSLFELEKMFNI